MDKTTIIYLEKDNKYLMLHRNKKEKDLNKDKWIGVGGHIEEYESPDQCIVREVKEETGLEIEVQKLIGIYTDSDVVCANGDKVHSICIGYEMSVVGGELICDENETLELKYFSLDNMPELFCKQHEELLRDIKGKSRKIIFKTNTTYLDIFRDVWYYNNVIKKYGVPILY